jgi:2'-5' RNA ligase
MLACNLLTPISLGSIIIDEDLEGEGLVLDSHITILYAKEQHLDKTEILRELEDRNLNYLKNFSISDNYLKVTDLFELGKFSNESDHLVLRLKNNSELYAKMKWLNTKLTGKYKIESEFDEYKPHLTLAQLKLGLADKYLGNETLQKILEDSMFQPEDFIISYGISGEDEWKIFDLTHHRSVDRFFRLRELKQELQDLRNNI